MLTYPKSTLGVLRMLMHLSSGPWLWHWGIAPIRLFPQSDLRCRADLRWALPQISSLVLIFVIKIKKLLRKLGLMLLLWFMIINWTGEHIVINGSVSNVAVWRKFIYSPVITTFLMLYMSYCLRSCALYSAEIDQLLDATLVCLYCLNCAKFGKLIICKIIKIV